MDIEIQYLLNGNNAKSFIFNVKSEIDAIRQLTDTLKDNNVIKIIKTHIIHKRHDKTTI